METDSSQTPESQQEAPAESKGTPIVTVTDLKKHFPIMKGLFRKQVGAVKAVDGVSFDIYAGETLGLVGESGSGKSTTGRVILQLDDATEGSVTFEGKELTTLKDEAVRALRPRMQMIFQDPHASLNPRMTVGSIIAEPLKEHNASKGNERQERVEERSDCASDLERDRRAALGVLAETLDRRPRRLDPGTGGEPPGGPPGCHGPHLPLHLP